MRRIVTDTCACSGCWRQSAAMLAGFALAGQPVTQTLTPPPPALEGWKAMEAERSCQGTRVLVEPDSPPASSVAAAASSIRASHYGDTINQVASRTYNLDGNLTNRFIEERYSVGAASSTRSTGADPAGDRARRDLRRPGRPRWLGSSATETTTGQFT